VQETGKRCKGSRLGKRKQTEEGVKSAGDKGDSRDIPRKKEVGAERGAKEGATQKLKQKKKSGFGHTRGGDHPHRRQWGRYKKK